jgi:hypothetical protein
MKENEWIDLPAAYAVDFFFSEKTACAAMEHYDDEGDFGVLPKRGSNEAIEIWLRDAVGYYRAFAVTCELAYKYYASPITA